MIDDHVFATSWRTLEERFGRNHGAAVLRTYKELLDPLLNTEQFQEACRSVFFSCEFFPRPADFVEALVSKEWPLVAQASRAWSTHSREWLDPFNELSELARAAVRLMGGIHAIHESRRAPAFLRRTFLEAAVEAAVYDDPPSLAPPGRSGEPVTRGGGPELVGNVVTGLIGDGEEGEVH